MSSLIQAVVALSWPLLPAGILSTRRWGIGVLLLLLVLAYIGGLSVGALLPSDPLYLTQWTGLGGSTVLLVLWAVYAMMAKTAGRARIPGPSLLVAMVSGALLGEVAAAALLTPGLSSRRSAARIALAAAAGGMLGRLGDPGMLLLTQNDPTLLVSLSGLALLCGAITLWRPAPILDVSKEGEGRWSVTAVGAATAVAAILLGAAAWLALLGGTIGLALLADRQKLRSLDWHLPVRVALLCGLVIFATAGGLPEMAAEGIEYLQRWVGSVLIPMLTGAAALLAALLDGPAAALFADATLDRALALKLPGARGALAAGVAVGGIGPLLIAGAVREGLWLWGVQIVLAIVWAGLVF